MALSLRRTLSLMAASIIGAVTLLAFGLYRWPPQLRSTPPEGGFSFSIGTRTRSERSLQEDRQYFFIADRSRHDTVLGTADFVGAAVLFTFGVLLWFKRGSGMATAGEHSWKTDLLSSGLVLLGIMGAIGAWLMSLGMVLTLMSRS
jgi:hypothetical protein